MMFGTTALRSTCPKASATIKAYGAPILSLLEAGPVLEPGTGNEPSTAVDFMLPLHLIRHAEAGSECHGAQTKALAGFPSGNDRLFIRRGSKARSTHIPYSAKVIWPAFRS